MSASQAEIKKLGADLTIALKLTARKDAPQFKSAVRINSLTELLIILGLIVVIVFIGSYFYFQIRPKRIKKLANELHLQYVRNIKLTEFLDDEIVQLHKDSAYTKAQNVIYGDIYGVKVFVYDFMSVIIPSGDTAGPVSRTFISFKSDEFQFPPFLIRKQKLFTNEIGMKFDNSEEFNNRYVVEGSDSDAIEISKIFTQKMMTFLLENRFRSINITPNTCTFIYYSLNRLAVSRIKPTILENYKFLRYSGRVSTTD